MTTIAPAGPSRTAASGRYPHRWLAAVAMMTAVLMDMIDVTIVNVALPTIRRDLGASATQLEWMVSAPMLVFAASVGPAGCLRCVRDRVVSNRAWGVGSVVMLEARPAVTRDWYVTMTRCIDHSGP